MNYHSRLRLGDGHYQHYGNGDLDWYKKNIIIPMFNNQIVVIDEWCGRKQVVVNLGTILEAEFYKTEEEIFPTKDKSIPQLMDEDSFQTYNCTTEVLDEVRQELASDSSKSVIQKSLSATKNQIFVVMQFGDIELDSAYEGVIEPLITDLGLEAVRVDKIQDAGKISDQILENIADSKVVISDLSGERPNCYYETGFAHALGKELILTIREKEKIHFDLAGYRFIVWKTEADLRNQLRDRLKIVFDKM